MIFIIALSVIALGWFLLANIGRPVGKRAYYLCSRLAMEFIKSGRLLYGNCLAVIVSAILILLASSNHFIIDFYIMFLFSSLILIKYHTLKLFHLSSV